MIRPAMEPVHLPEDDEEYHDAPEAAHSPHTAPDVEQHAAQHSDDDQDAFHDATEEDNHAEGGVPALHPQAQPAHDANGGPPAQSQPWSVHEPFNSGSSTREDPTGSHVDADGFHSSPDHRFGADSARAAGSAAPGEQFRPYADQQTEVGRVAEDEDADAEALSTEEAQARLEEAEALKKEGNDLYGKGDADAAAAKYSEALDAAPPGAKERAVYFANRAACQLRLKEWGMAAADCTRALEVDPAYIKALLRRCTAYEELDDLEKALTDAKKVVELDPANTAMAAKVRRLEPIVAERREKMKEEMMGKLKELGNTVLGKFGMSLDNFKAEKDPNTGSYSIQFKQNQ